MKPSDITTEAAFRAFCEKEFPHKKIKWANGYCFVQAGNHLEEELHYEFCGGNVALHIEGGNWRGIRNYLQSVIKPFENLTPRHWGRINCAWTLGRAVDTEKELFEAFKEIRDTLEPHILSYENTLKTTKNGKDLEMLNGQLYSAVCTVGELLNENLRIPHYQRPYRWTDENVRKLLEDVQTSWETGKRCYRIGSVILHSDDAVLDIVDGQQRLTTILLVLNACGVTAGMLDKLTYNHVDSFRHIRENYGFVKEWLAENVGETRKTAYANYLQEQCEFVKIVVTNRSEAFQMFDSQNGRGKELEAYNLLKAYHIGAMEQNSMEECIACDVRWEAAVQYDATPLIPNDDNIDILKQIFDEQLYRSRRWSRYASAGRFSKRRLGEFKGFTIDKNHPTLYPYQNPQLLQYLTAKFYRNTLEGTVATSNRLERGDSDHVNPFVNINQMIVNGKSFFDYVETYVELYKMMFLNLSSYQLADFKRFYYLYCLDYDCPASEVDERRRKPYAHLPKKQACRTGDTYLRELYKSLVLTLFDKFGEKGLNHYYRTLYRLVYAERIASRRVFYASVDKMPHDYFAAISEAKNLTDLRQWNKILATRTVDENFDMPRKNFIINGIIDE
ncbi:MAG: DUF262 domain-containing protein [Bacteroidales bacterium]|nr:DUF262 domain-containing protein [Bacteroidales bacterium]